VALAVLSGIEPAELVRAIRQGDLARLVAAPEAKRLDEKLDPSVFYVREKRSTEEAETGP